MKVQSTAHQEWGLYKDMEKKLFDRVKLGNIEIKNRLIRSATWEGLADVNGHLPETLYHTYEELAKGGVGAIITGFTSVADDDRYFGGMPRLSNDGLISEHQRLTSICHAENCPVIVQLALGEYDGGVEPDNMSVDDIRQVISMFVNAAIRADKAGYDGVQIHTAHGFFLSRFISPTFNHRNDEFGGNPEKRGRIITEIIHGVQENAPSLHITMKINSSDFMRGGLTPEESIRICRLCADAGINSVEVSGNGTSVSGIKAGINEAYFAQFALALAEIVSIPIILVGGHRSVENMEKVLNAGKIEFLSLSRPLIREPDLPNRWLRGEKAPSSCVSCNMCYRTPGHLCIFRPRENEYEETIQ